MPPTDSSYRCKRKSVSKHYHLGCNDFYLINIPDTTIFFLFPESVLYDRKFISDGQNTIVKGSCGMTIYTDCREQSQQNWQLDYMYDKNYWSDFYWIISLLKLCRYELWIKMLIRLRHVMNVVIYTRQIRRHVPVRNVDIQVTATWLERWTYYWKPSGLCLVRGQWRQSENMKFCRMYGNILMSSRIFNEGWITKI